MAKMKTTELIKQRSPLKQPNGPHILGRQLLAPGRTVVAPARAPLIPMVKTESLRSRRSDGPARNITKRARKETEEAIRDSEARYRRLFEAAQDGILILDANTG